MKAVRLFEFGGPEKLVYGDYPELQAEVDKAKKLREVLKNKR